MHRTSTAAVATKDVARNGPAEASMVDSKNIVLGALSGALAAAAVLIVANAATPSAPRSVVHPLVRAQFDTTAGVQADEQAVRLTLRPKDQSSLTSMAQTPGAAP